MAGSLGCDKPSPVVACGLLNVDSFFDGLIAYLDHATREQLIRAEHRAMLIVASTPEELLARFASYRAPAVKTWIPGPGET
jgi:predicted Rossmann-fold nucleotide-binding protein